MRRAYNVGQWGTSRDHAEKLLSRLSERTLARSIIVRSYWNEGRFQEVIDRTTDWHDQLSQSYRKQSIERLKANGGTKRLTVMKEKELQRLRAQQPEPTTAITWSNDKLAENFSHIFEGNFDWWARGVPSRIRPPKSAMEISS